MQSSGGNRWLSDRGGGRTRDEFSLQFWQHDAWKSRRQQNSCQKECNTKDNWESYGDQKPFQYEGPFTTLRMKYLGFHSIYAELEYAGLRRS